MKPLSLLLLSACLVGSISVGCSKTPPPPAAAGAKCYPASPDLGVCADGLFCLGTRGEDGQPVMEKVGADKMSAVGVCTQKAAIGEACTSTEGCKDGECTWKNPEEKDGVCTAKK